MLEREGRSLEHARNAFRQKDKGAIDVVESDYDYESYIANLPKMEEETAQEVFSANRSGDSFADSKHRLMVLFEGQHSSDKKVRERSVAKVRSIIDELASRKKESVPLEDGVEQSFVYRRYLQLVDDFKPVAMKLRDGKPLEADEIDTYVHYVTLERQKADWLEKELYPKMYERAVNAARGEVMQYLLVQKNNSNAKFEEFPDIEHVRVRFQDSLTYALEQESPNAAGNYRSGADLVTLNIPAYYDMRDEWRVYVVAVHEHVHSVSDQSMAGKVGLDQQYREPNFRELNEAITEIVTYIIASQHEGRYKTPLNKTTREKPNVMQSGYADYIALTQDLFGKIPQQKFVDAMLTADGFQSLVASFEEAYDNPRALIDFAENLRDLYLSPEERARKKRKKDGSGDVLEFESQPGDHGDKEA